MNIKSLIPNFNKFTFYQPVYWIIPGIGFRKSDRCSMNDWDSNKIWTSYFIEVRIWRWELSWYWSTKDIICPHNKDKNG